MSEKHDDYAEIVSAPSEHTALMRRTMLQQHISNAYGWPAHLKAAFQAWIDGVEARLTDTKDAPTGVAALSPEARADIAEAKAAQKVEESPESVKGKR